MKNLFIYYLAIILPLGVIIWVHKTALVSPAFFAVSILFYLLIYRTYIDGKRLADTNLISPKDIWKMVIPGSRVPYIRELYWK